MDTHRTRADLHAFGGRTGSELLADLSEAINHIVLFPPEAGSAFMSPFIYPFVLAALLGALAFLDGWRGFAIGVWSLAVLFAAVVLHGYWYYHVPLRVHRWLVVFPPLIALLAAFAARLAAPPRWSRRPRPAGRARDGQPSSGARMRRGFSQRPAPRPPQAPSP